MSDMATDLTRHLSRELEQLHGRHSKMATAVLAPSEVLVMMLEASINLACCAVASYSGTIAANGIDDVDRSVRDLVGATARLHGKCLEMRIDEIVAKTVPAVEAKRAEARA